jgi:hypothetical protein
MPQPLRKVHPALDLEKAQAQVSRALRRAFSQCPSTTEFWRRLNAKLRANGHKEISRQAMIWWESEGTFVDRIYWQPIEEISDYATTRRHLRPDLYPEDRDV